MLGLSRLLGPFLYPYSRAFPPPHLTIISTILLPNLPFYRPPDSLLVSGWRPGSCGADLTNTPSYAGAIVLGRGSVGPRGGARRGSAATGPGVPPGRRSRTAPSDRGAVRGATVAQTPVQLAGAAAQRDAREAGQIREAVGGDWPGLHCGKSCTCASAGEAEVAGM